ncbi:MAG: hypothetical protein WAU47_04350, partial [Desulfobaccales bacterium]
MGRSSRHLALLLVLALAFLFSWGPTPGYAAVPAETSWDVSTENWEDPGNWTLGVPTASLDAVIDNGGTAQISDDAYAQNLTAGRSASETATGSGYVSHLDAMLTVGTLTLGQEAVGESPGTWQYSSGRYDMNNTGGGTPSLTAYDLIVSDLGRGTFIQEGGTVTVTNNLILGNQIMPGAPQDETYWTYPISGQYSLWPGATAPTLEVQNQLIIGNFGHGGFEQYSGSVNVYGTDAEPGVGVLVIGKEAGSYGYYWLDIGFLTVGQEGSPPVTMYVGQGGRGYFSLDYYNDPEVEPSLQVYGNLVVGDQAGSWGKVEQMGGTAMVAGSLILGNLPGSSGEYHHYNGFLNVVSVDATPSTMYVGKGGQGYFYQYSALFVDGNMVVGDDGHGEVFSYYYSYTTVTGDLILGNQAGTGSYALLSLADQLQPNFLEVWGSLVVGRAGTGEFSQDGGEVSVGGSLI